jgi:threonine synthase
VKCESEYTTEPRSFFCVRCHGLLELVLEGKPPAPEELFPREARLGVWRYVAALPLPGGQLPITLGEGGTPLVDSVNMGPELRLGGLKIKNEGQNPTGSFKDRGMTVAVSRARERGARVLLCASTGNTAASLAAYASRAEMRSAVLVPSGKVAGGKLAQALVYGARVITISGGFDQALKAVMDLAASRDDLYLLNSVNPFRIEGQKTAAYEIFEQLGGKIPDAIVLPVGNAGNISAIWKGFKELKEWRITSKVPRMMGVQARGAAPIAEAFAAGRMAVEAWSSPQTVASAIRIGNPVSWMKALRAIKESKGLCLAVSDKEILRAQADLASREGVFAEAASASPIAALKHLRSEFSADDIVVCLATGSGLKEQHPIRESAKRKVRSGDEGGILRQILE